ncbi:MAG TPA: phospholipid carrier-dependent glycosyltransferase [Chloroflexota bacterium]
MLAEDQAFPAQPLSPAIQASRLRAIRGLLDREWMVVLLLAAWAIFLLFWRLDDPGKYIYDEVYHAFTGNLMVQNDPKVYEWWESAQSLPSPIEGTQYEWTHPPLGKLIIGGSIWLFGNNSLGWRFGNAVFGVICVLLVYALARLLFRDRLLATLAAAIISVEGLMFAESRISTNDIFQLAFLLAAYCCFAAFFNRPARHAIAWLFPTGLFLGLAFGAKWPALYSIVLLTVTALLRGIWPARWTAWLRTARLSRLRRRREAVVASVVEAEPSAAVAGDDVLPLGVGLDSEPPPAVQDWIDSELPPEEPAPVLLLTPQADRWPFMARVGYVAASLVALVLLPIAAYIASYIQMFLQPHVIPSEYAQIGPLTLGPISLGPANLPDSSWWSMFVGEQWQMWRYHTTLTAGHPYYSKWWEWLLDIRPVFYYVDRTDSYVANTYNLGNPLLYWGFPIAILLGLWLLWKRRDSRLALVMAAIAINWLPWALSPRGMFFYHFLPTVPFLVLLVAYCLTWLWRRPNRKWHRVAGIYVGLVFLSFAFFYTQLAAWPVPEWYADIHYWLPSWQ